MGQYSNINRIQHAAIIPNKNPFTTSNVKRLRFESISTGWRIAVHGCTRQLEAEQPGEQRGQLTTLSHFWQPNRETWLVDRAARQTALQSKYLDLCLMVHVFFLVCRYSDWYSVDKIRSQNTTFEHLGPTICSSWMSYILLCWTIPEDGGRVTAFPFPMAKSKSLSGLNNKGHGNLHQLFWTIYNQFWSVKRPTIIRISLDKWVIHKLCGSMISKYGF